MEAKSDVPFLCPRDYNRCILGVMEMEESGKEALKFSMNCGIAVSVGTL